LMKTRRQQPAFHPNADFDILAVDPMVFAIRRSCQDQTILAMTNISSSTVKLSLRKSGFADLRFDLISQTEIESESFLLEPYRYVWLTSKEPG
jgi:glucosylglycerate phosphorylase